MIDATAINEAQEFPFVEVLPKREKSRLLSVWELISELSRVSEQKGALVPVVLAAEALNVTRQRMHQFCDESRLEVVLVRGHKFITEDSLVAFAKQQRKSGRPFNLPTSAKDQFSAACRAFKNKSK